MVQVHLQAEVHRITALLQAIPAVITVHRKEVQVQVAVVTAAEAHRAEVQAVVQAEVQAVAAVLATEDNSL